MICFLKPGSTKAKHAKSRSERDSKAKVLNLEKEKINLNFGILAALYKE